MKNLFENTDVLRHASLQLFEENELGDCLCLVNRQYLVSIDHRDMKQRIVFDVSDPKTTLEGLLNDLTNIIHDPKNDKYCDGCTHLYPNEIIQDIFRKIKPSSQFEHICMLTSTQVKHMGEHPNILKPDNCPLNKK
jgi:hypothetical protein